MIEPAIPDFRDGKDPGALRTIGEVAKALGIRQHVLRYWEEQFPMLRPMTRAGGRRYYRLDDVVLLAEIDRLLHREGYTIKGARQALKGGAKPAGASEPDLTAPAAATAAPILSEGQVAAPEMLLPMAGMLRAIRDRLAAAIDD